MLKDPIDLNEIRARLAGARGKQYWRSLEELADTTAFKEFLHREFPKGAAELNEPLNRRTFLKLMGASLALAGLGGCAAEPPREKIVPYVNQPDPAITPGKPLFFATAMPIGGYGLGLLAESHIGRPTKVEGNPEHPASLGATDVFAQASVLSLYDPDRAQAVTNLGQISTWDTFTGVLSGRMQQLQANQGAGLRILTETITSPTLGAQIQALLQKLPQAKWHQYDPAGYDNVREGAHLAFGQYANTIYNFAKADRILALDANFLQEVPGHLRYTREFIGRRQVSEGQADMNRLYVVESTPTITGAMADHRLPLRASQIEGLARAVAQALGVQVGGTAEAPQGIPAGWIDAVVRDLQQRRGASIVIAGPAQPPVVHTLAHAMNQALGNIGTTVIYTQPVEVNPVNQLESLRELAADMASGTIDTLIIIESNPVFTAPADLNFADLIRKLPFTVQMSQYFDETAALSQWHIPQTHYLEAWGDVRAFDGTVSIMQPLILPLYNGKSAYELLGAMSGGAGQSNYDIVRAYWQGQRQGGDFEQFWRQSVHDGVVAGTASAPMQVTLNSANLPAQAAAPPEGSLEIIFRPDSSVWDGRFANNGWLQELPRQLTTITWDNAAYVSPATAQRLGYNNEDLVELRFEGRAVRAPIWIVPGHADDAVTLHIGYGRQRAGQVGTGVGANAYAIRTSGAPWFGSGLEVAGTGERYPISTTQQHFSVEGRDLVREGTLEQFRQNPDFARNEFDEFLPRGRPQQQAAAAGQQSKAENQGGEEQNIPSLYPEYRYSGYAWGMAINLNACIGCNACTIACQAENNIPVVGKEQVGNSREMHWLKVDVYNSGGLDNPDTVFQPRPCMHCEKAPCELVCPVAATTHDAEGLNTMVYNRCIGTRYCSNNCPYKVRRFNFLTYNEDIPVINLVHNPDVTVRARGVMEKCTYCIQRIEEARITAERETRTIRDREVLTACQQVCPTNAIVFGNINDPNSQVSQLKGRPLHYGMLAELGTQPRTTYLARLRNPNPELGG